MPREITHIKSDPLPESCAIIMYSILSGKIIVKLLDLAANAAFHTIIFDDNAAANAEYNKLLAKWI